VVVRDGGWYLLGHDQDRRAARAFKLTRVEGPVRATGPAGAFDIPADLDADALIGLRRPAPLRSAVLALRPERAGALRARARVHGDETGGAVPGRDVVVVDFTSVRTIADEVAGYGDAVVVLDPPDVRAAVIDRLLAATRLTGPTEGAHRG